MNLCLFEDGYAWQLEPMTLTRPVFDLWCGARSLLARQQQAVPALETGVLIRSELVDLCRDNHPQLVVNDAGWLENGPAILVNARWLPPPQPLTDLSVPRIGLVGSQVAYVVPPPTVSPKTILDKGLESWKQTLPTCTAGGAMIDYPWDLIEHNDEALTQDWDWFRTRHQPRNGDAGLTVLGPPDRLLVAENASLESPLVVDTRQGPVMIDEGAIVHSFSKLEGPCYVGPQSWLMGLKLRSGTIGPQCRVGGEFEASIMQGHSNKYHDGFLGHSYIGEWVNLAAGTQTSDLRNDYGPVKVWVGTEQVATGLTKVGSFIGDHTKTGLNVLLNTGTIVGAFCNLLPGDGYLPRLIPSFCTVQHGQLLDHCDLRQLLSTATTVMKRRGCTLSLAQSDFLFPLYEQTAAFRRQVIRDWELRRLRRSV